MQPTRRDLIQGLAAATTASSLAGCDSASGYPRGPLHDELDPLARALAEVERERVFELVLEHLRTGRSLFDLFRAVLLAAAADLRADSGGWLHCVLAANSALHVSSTFSDADRLLPVLWWVDRFKLSQAGAGGSRRLDVLLGPVPAAAQAGAALDQALESWDPQAADAAVAGLAREGDRNGLLRRLQLYGVRDQNWVGHTTIHTAQLSRALDRLGWSNMETPLRQLVAAMFVGKPGPTTAPFDANRPRAASLRAGWDAGVYLDSAVSEMVGAARSGSPDELARHVLAELNRSVSPESLWDGIVTYAVELTIRAPEGRARIGGLHALTTADALRKIADDAVDDSVRGLALLQAASWMALFREYVAAHAGAPLGDLDLVRLEPGTTPASAGELLEIAGNDRLAGARATIAWIESGRGLDAISTAILQQAVRKAKFDEHEYKFPVAILDQAARAGSRWAPRILAAFAYGGPRSTNPPWARLAEADAIVTAAGPVAFR